MRSVRFRLAWTAVGLFLFASTANAQKRVWTAKSGHQVIATLEDQTDDAVSLRIANRAQPVVVSIDELIEEDQQFAKRNLPKEPLWVIGKPGDHARRMQNALFADYVRRMEDRREQALQARRAYNANKGPAVYYIGSMPDPMFPMGIAIERGWVWQPPIPRPYFGRRYPWWNRRLFVADPFVQSFSD